MSLRHLVDTKAILGATDNGTILVRRESEVLIGEAALADLTKFYLDNPLMEIRDEKVRRRSSTEYTDYSLPGTP